MERNCGNCDYCAENDEDLVCMNEESEYYTGYVSEEHSCPDWDGTEEDDED